MAAPDEGEKIAVLLVDDEHDFLVSMSKPLARRGFRVFKSTSSRFVDEMLEKIPIDVAVLDVKMPDLDGPALFEEIRRRLPGLPVIFLTGHGTQEQAREMADLGLFAYLTKPCEVDDLAQTIRAAVRARDRHAADA